MACLILAACGGEDPSGSTGPGGGDSAGDGGGGAMPGDEVGAVLPCPPGELEQGGACLAPGVPETGCAAGFAHDGEGGCVAILPAEACSAGQLALPGETSCHDVAPCGSGTWGSIPVEASTVYVDGSYAGGNGNGTLQQPFTSVQAALQAAAPGAIVAIAAGTYDESLTLSKPVRLWGKCPREVTISSPSTAVHVPSGGSGSELRGLSITGASTGVYAEGAAVLLDGVRVHDTGWEGVYAMRSGSGAQITVRGSLIERASGSAVSVLGSEVRIEDSVLRDTQPFSSGGGGRGILADVWSGANSGVTVLRSILEGHRELGISAWGTDITVEDSLIRDIQSNSSEGLWGGGIGAWRSFEGVRSSLVVRGSVIERTRQCALCAGDSDLTVERSVARDTLPEEGTLRMGYGMRLYGFESGPGDRPRGVIRESLIDGAHVIGLVIKGAEATLERTEVRHIEPSAADDNFGRGISIEVTEETAVPADATLEGVRVLDAYDVGIFVVGSNVDLDSVHVRDIHSRRNDGIFGAGIGYATEVIVTHHPSSGSVARTVVENTQAAGFGVAGAQVVAFDLIVDNTRAQEAMSDFGDGVVVSSFLVLIPDIIGTSLDLTRATVKNSARAGVAAFGASVTLSESLLECNQIDLDGEVVAGSEFVFENAGNNVCRCGATQAECRVLSSNLAPPTPAAF